MDAIRDLNISLKVEISSSGKRQIEAELMIALDKFKGMGSSGKKINENQSEDRGLMSQMSQTK